MSKSKTTELTLGQKKLSSLRINLPMVPLTTAGSLPKHIELRELRYKVSRNVASLSDLERREKLSTEGWLREQARLGFDVLVDGEMGRSDLVTYFAKKINGFERSGSVRIYGNRYYQKPVITGKISWKEPLISSEWQVFQRTAQKTVKAILTGPYTLMDCSFNSYYKTREEALKDLTAVIQKEVNSLIELGAKIIQIDEMSLGARPEEFPLIATALKHITQNPKAYFVLRHGYDNISALWPDIEKLPVDNFYFESTHTGIPILMKLKKFPTQKDFTIGVVDSHSHTIESTNDISKRIKTVLKYIPAKQLWLGTDSGLKTRTPEEATTKLSNLAKTVQKIRDQF